MPEVLTPDHGLIISSHDDHLADWLARPKPLGIGDVVRFDHAKQQWHVWDGFIWAPDRTTHVIDMVREMALKYTDQAKSAEERKALDRLYDTNKKSGVLKSLAARRHIAMRGDEWDPDWHLMAFKNGVLNLKTGEFDDHPDPALLISRSTGVDWDPDADMTPFATFVSQIMGGDPELTEYLLRVLGYAMLGFQREQKFWMWVGGGQNGKGVLAKVVAAALGDYADSPSSELYMKTRAGAARSDVARPDLLRLQGVRFTWMSEPSGMHFNDEMLKAHTGDDPITARDLYGKAASFSTWRPTHTIVFLTNDPPRTDDTGPSMRRRARMIKFEQDFTGERDDKGLEDRLKEPQNRQGVLRALAIGAAAYFRDGLVEPAQVTEWSSSYIEENNPLASFIAEACVVEKGAKGQAALMWAAYQDWCATRGTDTGSQTGFGLQLGRMFQKVKGRTGAFYAGIRPKSAIEEAESDG